MVKDDHESTTQQDIDRGIANRRALKGQPETADDDPAALDENTLAENKFTIEAEEGVAREPLLDVVGTMPGQLLGPLVEEEVEKRELASDDPAVLDQATLAENKSTIEAEERVARRDASLDEWQSDAATKIKKTTQKSTQHGLDSSGQRVDAEEELEEQVEGRTTMPGQPLGTLVEEEIPDPGHEKAVSSGLDLTDGIAIREPDGSVFDPRTGSVDEAETLVAPSTEVKDSHDRYANIEVSTPREAYPETDAESIKKFRDVGVAGETTIRRLGMDAFADRESVSGVARALDEESSMDTSVVLDEGHADPDLAVPHEPGEVCQGAARLRLERGARNRGLTGLSYTTLAARGPQILLRSGPIAIVSQHAATRQSVYRHHHHRIASVAIALSPIDSRPMERRRMVRGTCL